MRPVLNSVYQCFGPVEKACVDSGANACTHTLPIVGIFLALPMDPPAPVLKIEKLTSQQRAAFGVSMDAALWEATRNECAWCVKRSDRCRLDR